MASHGAFSAEEFGSGSRLTPVVDAPAWLKARSQTDGERVTLTPSDRAFLESPPTYEEGGSLLPRSLPPRAVPSQARRLRSRLLFFAIGGSAAAVLVLAALRYLAHSLLGS
jgi:hypothetical protein